MGGCTFCVILVEFKLPLKVNGSLCIINIHQNGLFLLNNIIICFFYNYLQNGIIWKNRLFKETSSNMDLVFSRDEMHLYVLWLSWFVHFFNTNIETSSKKIFGKIASSFFLFFFNSSLPQTCFHTVCWGSITELEYIFLQNHLFRIG